MASSPSSSSSSVQQKYEVFLSLSEDTRNNFASHLHEALKRHQINTFVSYPLERGEEISGELMLAIEESKISIIVLSKSYALSSWCSEELCKILECKEKNGQTVLPIFYHVDPSDVRNQTGSFAIEFAKHQERFKDGTDQVERWRAALAEVTNLVGFYLDEEEDRRETELIEDIVKFIWKKFNELSTDVKDLVRGLVGMESRIEELKALLDDMDSKGVRIIGIWGMPGVGKTTTADVLFKHISCQFHASYFVANFREKSMGQGLECLQNELSPLLKKTNWHPRKVLIVLDDVNDSEQVEYLIGDQSSFGPGSTIIITSRDRRVLRLMTNVIYTVEKLTYVQAIEFCNQFAFGGNRSISIQETMELSHWVVQYADGIPLALKILGYFLYDEKKGTLDSALRRLENAPNKEIHQVFSISYDGLTKEEKGIFLDVACFFKGEDKNRVADILDGCGFSAHLGITVLNDWFLITILNDNLEMHNLAQVMGWEIVRRESKHPGKRSRLWRYKDIVDVLTTNKGTKTVEGIFLNMSEIEKPICINPEAFLRMCNLRLLKIYSPHSREDYKVHLPVGFQICSNKLAYLHWHCYPLESLPLNFDPENLVELHMHYSRVIQLWEGTPKLQKLKWIDLSYSKHLKEMPDLSKAPNLVRIDLMGCSSLMNIPVISENLTELLLNETSFTELPSTIASLGNLDSLHLNNCRKLQKLPSIIELKSLKSLYLSCCTRLESLPELPPKLQYLDAHNCTSLEPISSSFPISRGLGQRFIFTNCKKMDQNTVWSKTQLSIQQTVQKQDLRQWYSSICICFPGSEIPRWFDHQNLGSSVTILLPPNLPDYKFMGFVLCAVVAFEDYNKDLGFTIKCRCNFKTKGEDCHDYLSYLSVWDKSDSPRFIGSDHVFLGYDFNLCSDWYREESKYHFNEVSFEFSACDSDLSNPLDSCIFRKCGVCLFYVQADLSENEIVGESEK